MANPVALTGNHPAVNVQYRAGCLRGVATKEQDGGRYLFRLCWHAHRMSLENFGPQIGVFPRVALDHGGIDHARGDRVDTYPIPSMIERGAASQPDHGVLRCT